MPTKIYVGNLAFSTDSAALRALFAPHGEVTSAQVVEDRDSGRSRGFGFVEMSSAEEAQKAIAATDGKTLDGRQLRVSLAKARPS
ncbi:MAG: RNA-binding protein [Actinobacteria bacterium]|nr:RNA-binding protein [Actinomycetota bacterium]